MLGEHYEFVGLMVSLLLKGLLDTGEYFVVGIDTRQYDPRDPQKYLEGMFHQDTDNISQIIWYSKHRLRVHFNTGSQWSV